MGKRNDLVSTQEKENVVVVLLVITIILVWISIGASLDDKDWRKDKKIKDENAKKYLAITTSKNIEVHPKLTKVSTREGTEVWNDVDDINHSYGGMIASGVFAGLFGMGLIYNTKEYVNHVIDMNNKYD